MSDLQAIPGELKFTVEITRKATGLTETVDMTSLLTQEQEDALVASNVINLKEGE